MSDEPERQRPKIKAFDLLGLVADFALREGIALNDPLLTPRFMADAEPRLKEALSDPALIYGSRTERLFEATVLSLGKFQLLKVEDTGRVHAAAFCRAPDFRIVLNTGEQWLIEVKNVRIDGTGEQKTRISAPYLSSLELYADMVGVPLKFAIFWSSWNIWTVISPNSFRHPKGGLYIAMKDALFANESEKIGEVVIGTKPPLRLILTAAEDKSRSLTAEGLAQFFISSVKFFSGNTELTDSQDLRFAEVLFRYGDWPVEGPFSLMREGTFAGVEFVAKPEGILNKGFEGIGWASQIFSRFYTEQTVVKDQVIQLNGEASPEWFIPLANWDFKASKLPLLLLRQETPIKR